MNCHVFLQAEIKAAERTLARPPKNITQHSLQIVRAKLMIMRAALGGLHPEAETGEVDHKRWIRRTVAMLGADLYKEKTTSALASLALVTHLNAYDR